MTAPTPPSLLLKTSDNSGQEFVFDVNGKTWSTTYNGQTLTADTLKAAQDQYKKAQELKDTHKASVSVKATPPDIESGVKIIFPKDSASGHTQAKLVLMTQTISNKHRASGITFIEIDGETGQLGQQISDASYYHGVSANQSYSQPRIQKLIDSLVERQIELDGHKFIKKAKDAQHRAFGGKLTHVYTSNEGSNQKPIEYLSHPDWNTLPIPQADSSQWKQTNRGIVHTSGATIGIRHGCYIDTPFHLIRSGKKNNISLTSNDISQLMGIVEIEAKLNDSQSQTLGHRVIFAKHPGNASEPEHEIKVVGVLENSPYFFVLRDQVAEAYNLPTSYNSGKYLTEHLDVYMDSAKDLDDVVRLVKRETHPQFRDLRDNGMVEASDQVSLDKQREKLKVLCGQINAGLAEKLPEKLAELQVIIDRFDSRIASVDSPKQASAPKIK